MRQKQLSNCTSMAKSILCCCFFFCSIAPPCGMGNAFVLSAASPCPRLKVITLYQRYPTRICCGDEVEERATAGETGDPEEDDDEDFIHPSAAWLYQPSMNPTSEISSRPTRRTLAVDYGSHRVGLAIGVGISPRTVPGVTNRGNNLDLVRQVLIRARGEGIRDIVVGLPLVRNGTETEMCKIVRGFASILADAGAASRSPASVYLWDERFSSAHAGALLDRHGGGMNKKVEIDSLAASLILEDYFAGGGVYRAEKVKPRTATAAILFAAGRTGQQQQQQQAKKADVDEEGSLFGEGSKRRLYEKRMESIRRTSAEEFVPMMPARKSKRKRRKRM